MRRPSRLRSVACMVCGASFETRHSQGKYCSDQCRKLGARKSWRDYNARNAGHRKDYRKKYYERNAEKVSARVKSYRKTDAGRRATHVNGQRQRQKFPERYAARQAVTVALRSGRLVRLPCQRCGAVPAQAHHRDYSKPLDVEWLCAPHHREADAELKRGGQ